ncbi:DNA primase [Nocardiopsis sp. RSe5-2]|uniref:DNA primase n=1 Tax=Nocardiopsis endophytica TaxID=3018445 RepID=A0ABT4UBK1_9ACTN|nr:DNA primase [Nocardiopsis endophytica]MDA2814364.1 DNA primase [Nocardiopsis endophytica]
MAGRIRDEDIALVRERSPIAEVIGEYLQLRNAGGGSLKGLCPFHDEKSPSFNVTPSRGLYHCFGCGVGGDVITFVQEMDHISFVEAVEALAAKAGIRLRYEEGGYTQRGDQGQRQRLIEAHRAAQEFYAEKLLAPEARHARRFLTDRGFARADAERFGVGYAPGGWEALTAHLRGKGFSDKEIVTAGLGGQGRRGAYDKFRDRLVWPVREVTGETVGFGARRLSERDDGPKYLNTPETPIFKKGHLLYGLDMAKREMARSGRAVIVEGYTDVMACHLSGVPTAVATCGTSFGEDHVKLLRRILLDRGGANARVVFTFDGDAAGRKAAVRAFAEEHNFAAETFVAVEPDGLDPCDLRLQKGAEAVEHLIGDAKPLYEFMVREVIERYDLDTAEGRMAGLDAAAEIVASIRNEGVRKLYGVHLDRWLGIMDEEFVRRRVEQHVRGARTGGGRPRGGPAPAAPPGAAGTAPYDLRDPSLHRERQALKIAVQAPALAAGFDELDEDAFTAPQHKAVLELIRAQGGVAAAGEGAQWAARLREAAPDEERRAFVTALGVERVEVDGELDERYARNIIDTILVHSANRAEANLKSRLARLDPAADAEEYNRVFAELLAAGQRKRAVRERIAGSG